MEKRDWQAERWLLRRVRVCGFAAPGNETIDAAVRVGAAASRVAGAEALDALIRLGLLEEIDGIMFLTRMGAEAAEAASGFARQLGEPPVPIPDWRLPSIVWVDDGEDGGLTRAPEEVCSARPIAPQEVPMASSRTPEKERFSLDDPEAGRKLVENLDERHVRLAFSDLCWHFRCCEHDEKMRLRSFLIDLDSQGLVVEVLPDLYCRPALTRDGRGTKSARRAVKKVKDLQRKPRGAKTDDGAETAPAESPPIDDDVA